jgi:hypothetical protein
MAKLEGTVHQGANRDSGSISRLTTLSPVRPERLAALRRRLAFVAWAPGVGRPLLDVATIHFARWIVFGSLPDPTGMGRPWRLNWQYLLFAATYDGPEDAYLDTFADVLPLRLAAVFGNCYGFESKVENAPGAGDRVFPAYAFREFVDENRMREYRHADAVRNSVRDVRQALAITRTVQRSELLSGAALDRVQSAIDSMALGPPPTQPGYLDAIRQQWMPVIRRDAVKPLTIAAPLERVLDVPTDVLRELPDTLFARLVTVPGKVQWQLGHQNPDQLATSYVVLMTDYCGRHADYVEALRRTPAIAEIFGHCVRFPRERSTRRFHEWIAVHRLKTQYYVAGYPVPPLPELQKAVQARAAIQSRLLKQTVAGGS